MFNEVIKLLFSKVLLYFQLKNNEENRSIKTLDQKQFQVKRSNYFN